MKKFLLILVVLGGLVWAAYHYGWIQKLYDQPGQPVDEEKVGQIPVTLEEAEAAAELLKQARTAARGGDAVKARSLFRQIAEQHPGTWAGREASLEMGDFYLKEGRRVKALAAFEAGLRNTEGERFRRISDLIRQLRVDEGLEPDEPVGDTGTEDTIHVVRKSDMNLTNIARLYSTTIEQIKLANGRTRDLIVPGELLKITYQMPEVRVLKTSQKLQVSFKGQIIKEYPVGIGKEGLTPDGEFTITEKLKDPPWYRDGQERIPYGDPRNILGTRWMTLLSASGQKQGYGIHGTSEPDSVPGATSAGCVRMLNKDVEELFEWVPRGTKVIITNG